jgi:cytochrome c-type biogenesis protein CcmH
VIELYLGMAVLLVLALLIVLLAASSRPTGADASRHLLAQQGFFLQRQRELQAEYDNGQIDNTQLGELQRELKRQLVKETAQQADFSQRRSGRGGFYLLLLLMPLLAIFLYQQMGYREDLLLRDIQRQLVAADELTPKLLGEFDERLSSALEKRPDSGDHLAMMASLRRQAGDFAGAAPYYERLLALYPNDASLMAQLAQARYLSNNRQLTAESRELLKQALVIDTNQGTALGVLGIDAFANGDYLLAINYWQRMLPGLRPGSSEYTVIQQGLNAAKSRAQEAGDLAGLSVSLNLAESLPPPPGGILFIVAKSLDGNPMPVAALRLPVSDTWPVSAVLSDADVIRPGQTLADFDELEISAHISLAGTAIRQAGDWIAMPQRLQLAKQKNINLLIDQILKAQ